nr:MAG TPA: hypothetical protein [Caudoviricetes sp.]
MVGNRYNIGPPGEGLARSQRFELWHRIYRPNGVQDRSLQPLE